MPRYFFNVHHRSGLDGVALDPDGDEVADVEMAREHALAMARDLVARTHLDSVANWFDCVFEIADELGRAVMTVPFTDIAPGEEAPGDW